MQTLYIINMNNHIATAIPTIQLHVENNSILEFFVQWYITIVYSEAGYIYIYIQETIVSRS